MRLLFLSFAFPLPANNGHRMRTWSVLRGLGAEGHDVTLLTFGHQEEVELHNAVLRQVCQEIETVPLVLRSLSSTTNHLDRLLGSFMALPYSVRRFASATMRKLVQDHLSRGVYDAVVCDTPYSAVNLPRTHVPVIINSHNVEHVVLRRYAAVERNPLKRLYARSEMRKLRRWERDSCQRAAMVLACSEPDRNLLSSLATGPHVTIAPNVVDIDIYVPQEQGEASTILFQGGMDWLPNRDAVTYFAKRILPHVRQRVPGIRFVVAGRNPSPAFIKQFAGVQGIEFAGNVPDMRAEIAKAAVCVVPLRIGSGTRLKILEAAAMATPVVSTRIGAEGLDFADGEEIVLADMPGEFACAVADLVADPSRRRTMGLAARRRLEAQYTMSSLRCALREALAKLPPDSLAVVPAAGMDRVEAEVRP